MQISPRARVALGAFTTLALAAAACVGNGNAPPGGPGLDAGFSDDSASVAPTDGAPSDAGDAGSAPGVDSSAPAEAGSDGAPSTGDAGDGGSSPGADSSAPVEAGSDLDGSADGGASFGTALTPALYAAASDDGSAMIISAPDGPPESVAFRFSHFEPGQGWSTPADVPGTLGTWTGTPPHVAMDAAGNAFLAWSALLEGDGSAVNDSVLVSRYDHATQAWTTPVGPDGYTDETSNEIALAVSPGGTAMVASAHNGATAAHAMYALRYAGGAWTTELVLAQSQGLIDTPSAVQVLDNGRAVILWTGNGGPGVAMRDTSGVWTAGTALASISASDSMAVAMDNAGDVVLPYENGLTYAYEYDAADAGWSGPTTASSSAGTQFDLSAGMNVTTGDAVVTHAYLPSAGVQVVESVVYSGASPTWQSPQVVPTSGLLGGLSTAYDSAGDALILWVGGLTSGTSTAAQLYSSTYSIDGGWTAASPPLTDTFTYTNQSLVAAMSSGGQHAWVVWTEDGAAYALRVK